MKSEADDQVDILYTQLQFSSPNTMWSRGIELTEQEFAQRFVFAHVGKPIKELGEVTVTDYIPNGGTPLLDAIGYGIEKIKAFHGDKISDENLKIIVTIITDGEENSSTKWNRAEIKKMVEHFQSDGKWTFTFVGCGSLDNVTAVSSTLGVSANATTAYAATDAGSVDAFQKISVSYCNYSRSVKTGIVDDTPFISKSMPTEVVDKK